MAKPINDFQKQMFRQIDEFNKQLSIEKGIERTPKSQIILADLNHLVQQYNLIKLYSDYLGDCDYFLNPKTNIISEFCYSNGMYRNAPYDINDRLRQLPQNAQIFGYRS